MKHNNFKQRVLTFALAAVFAIGGLAIGVNSYAADGTGTANATVVTPIAIGANSPNLRFGSFSTTDAGQTVTIATDGTRTTTDALVLGQDTDFGAASFAVTGEGTLTYAITLPSSTVSIASGANTMNLTSFTSFPSDTGQLTDGAQTLSVGATLTTGADQTTGTYTSDFTVSVDYN